MEAARRLRPFADVLLATVLTVLVQAEIWLTPAPDPDEVPATGPANAAVASAAALLFTVALAWRQRRPLFVLLLAYPAVALSTTASLDASMALAFAVMVASYSAGAHTRGRSALAAAAGVAGLVVLAIVRAGAGVEEPSDVILPLSMFGGPWLVGVAIRERRDRETVLEERAAILERERQEQARTAVAEERARIAREMHDIVAHAMSVIVVQARGGRRALVDDPEMTRSALDAIESTSTQALAEMRQLLDVLQADEAAPRAPQPGLAMLDGLVNQLHEAGLRVDVRVDGPAADLPAGIDRAAYRIIQEALTNIVRHAGVTSATVSIAYQPDDLVLIVHDAGTVGDASAADGRGIAGMRERAVSLGGTLDAGPDAGGGFSVRARLPLTFVPA